MSRDPRMDEAAVRRRASILRIATIPFTVVAAVVAVKIIAMLVVAQVTVATFDDEDYETSTGAAQWNLAVNVVEPYRVHFNLGTALLASGLDQEARTEFETALVTAPEPDSCDIRLNLSYAIEGLGDTAYGEEDLEAAAELYREAAAVLAEADESCPDTTERQEELLEKAEQAEEELEQQQEQQNGEGDPNDPNGGGSDGGSGGGSEGEGEGGGGGETDNPFDDIEQRGNEAEQERQDEESRDRGRNSSDYSNKPW